VAAIDLRYDAIIVGAGFAGLYMLHRLRRAGFRARVFEAGSGIGGTWFWNRYPGARCDVESMEYSYQFSPELEQEWEWSERYAPQPEILAYANHVADRFDLRGDIELNTRVQSAHYDSARCEWSVTTARGSAHARFCIMATGCLSSTNTPRFADLADFRGRTFHTGNWPHGGVDFAARVVGVIGTGSSAIQSIPVVAEQARHLYVFQRTANFSVPAQNAPLAPATQAAIKAHYGELRSYAWQQPFGSNLEFGTQSALAVSAAEREQEFERRWQKGGLAFLGAYIDLLTDERANAQAAEFIRNKIRAIVDDPATAALLCPTHIVGCKRLCADTQYFATFNRANVSLIDIRTQPIERFTRTGLTTGGREFVLDDVVFATGFDAMTGALDKIDIRGRDGVRLLDKWAAGPRTYLGLGTAGFPNLFTITGPGSPAVLSNMLPSIEQHVNWIADCMTWLVRHDYRAIEATPAAEDAWVAHVNQVAETTLYPHCNSWYLGANVPGKPRVFMPYVGVPPYVAKCNAVAANDYEGFALARA
jgi:cyclohexanone monooxygenase